jgi:hypothetical protein
MIGLAEQMLRRPLIDSIQLKPKNSSRIRIRMSRSDYES